jgi:hypothetical protein
MNGLSRGFLTTLGLAFGSMSAHAGGYTSWAVPSSIELVNGGALVSGNFGDPNSCGRANYVFVNQTSSNYKEVVAMAYMAFAAGKEMMFYSQSCTAVGFHWDGNVINLNHDGHTASVR